MKSKLPFLLLLPFAFSSCVKNWDEYLHNGGNPKKSENPFTFHEVGSIDLGDEGAAEISAFDPLSNRLFVVNNDGTSRIDVVDLADPTSPQHIYSIDISIYGGAVNSVVVKDGKLAAAIEGFAKTDNGKIIVVNTDNYNLIKSIPVGALPDMVTFSPDGKWILSANEAEPNDDYSIDPVGSVSFISVKKGYAVKTVDFSAFAGQQAQLMQKGLRVFGPGSSFAQDMEPEYIAISSDSKTAWVTLQENNAVARLDISSQTIESILPLGTKDFSKSINQMDASDKDGKIEMHNWPVKSYYLPDAIAVIDYQGKSVFLTANEGDSRDYSGFSEEARVKDLLLDPAAFPNAAALQKDDQLGRLKITTTAGDTDGDGDYDQLFGYGARSFSIWNGKTGEQLFDSRSELEDACIADGVYDDGRSDDKGVEPESVTIGEMNNRFVGFVGMERSNSVAIYDFSNPLRPKFLKRLDTGAGPEGLLFVAAKDNSSGESMLIVSSEVDGTVKIYKTN